MIFEILSYLFPYFKYKTYNNVFILEQDISLYLFNKKLCRRGTNHLYLISNKYRFNNDIIKIVHTYSNNDCGLYYSDTYEDLTVFIVKNNDRFIRYWFIIDELMVSVRWITIRESKLLNKLCLLCKKI